MVAITEYIRFTTGRSLRPALLGVATALGVLAAPVQAQDEGAAPAPKVSIAAAYTQDITDEATFIGRGEAIDKVSIVARVSGFLQSKEVEDGSAVEEGQLLFEIEPDLYEATLDARKADLDRAEAQLELAKLELARKEELLKRDAVPVSERDIARANELVAEASVKSAHAAIQQAELDLSYLFISHDMAVVERVSHYVGVMYLGRIVEIGPRREVFENPQHPYTQALMKAVPIADPRQRKSEKDLNFKPIPSPIHPVGYEPAPSEYREVSPGHLILTTDSGY